MHRYMIRSRTSLSRVLLVGLAAALAGGAVPVVLSATPAGASTPHGTPIVVGVIADETVTATGASKDFPNLMAAWEKYTNAHGGINGHPVSYINEDERRTRPRARPKSHPSSNDHVVAIMDDGTDRLDVGPDT